MSWLPISYDKATGQGCYVMRMPPGAVTIAHDHPGMEEFLILEGELIDDDGTVFKTGDFVSYDPGTHHNSRTETGCLIAVFEWQPPEGVIPRTQSRRLASSHSAGDGHGEQRDGNAGARMGQERQMLADAAGPLHDDEVGQAAGHQQVAGQGREQRQGIERLLPAGSARPAAAGCHEGTLPMVLLIAESKASG